MTVPEPDYCSTTGMYFYCIQPGTPAPHYCFWFLDTVIYENVGLRSCITQKVFAAIPRFWPFTACRKYNKRLQRKYFRTRDDAKNAYRKAHEKSVGGYPP